YLRVASHSLQRRRGLLLGQPSDVTWQRTGFVSPHPAPINHNELCQLEPLVFIRCVPLFMQQALELEVGLIASLASSREAINGGDLPLVGISQSADFPFKKLTQYPHRRIHVLLSLAKGCSAGQHH